MKKSFIFYTEWKELFDTLNSEQAGDLIKAILSYQTGQEIKLDPTLSLVFIPIRQTLDRDGIKYDSRVEANRKNGVKGGRPKSHNPGEPTKPTGLNGNPNNLDNDNDNDNDNEETEPHKTLSLKDNSGDKKQAGLASRKKLRLDAERQSKELYGR